MCFGYSTSSNRAVTVPLTGVMDYKYITVSDDLSRTYVKLTNSKLAKINNWQTFIGK